MCSATIISEWVTMVDDKCSDHGQLLVGLVSLTSAVGFFVELSCANVTSSEFLTEAVVDQRAYSSNKQTIPTCYGLC